MSQIHNIVKALRALAMTNPMATALNGAGFTGTIHQGTDASRQAPRPFGLLTAERLGGQFNSSGVSLVTYRVTLQVIDDESVGVVGDILEMFHRYWDRLRTLPGLPDEAVFVHVWPEEAEQGEAAEQDMGSDIMLGVTSWTLELAEHQPSLEEV